MAKKVIATFESYDYDTENLFPDRPLLEDMADESSGEYDIQPRKTLRERPYGTMPLILRPEYKGDFLEKLRERYKNKAAADPNSLWDFSDAEELLKHQEEPFPRDMVDEFYEMARPGPGPGRDTLKDYDDRGWSENEAPEMSEDRMLRMRNWKNKKICPRPMKLNLFRSAHNVIRAFLARKSKPDPQKVIARYLLERCPHEMVIDLSDENIRTAKYLKDFEKTLIFTKTKGWRKPGIGGVSVQLIKNERKVGRWTFSTSSGGDSYTTIFQFIPEKNIKEVDRLQVRVSCSCPSFLFYGAQFNAVIDDYFYGAIRSKFTRPSKRDPTGRFLVCKHILACIPTVSQYRLQTMEKEVARRLRGPAKIKVVKGPEEELRIPKELQSFADRPDIKDAEEKWNTMPRSKKKQFILSLDSPGAVSYMAHRFPDPETTKFVVEKLKAQVLAERETFDRSTRLTGEWARRLLREIV